MSVVSPEGVRHEGSTADLCRETQRGLKLINMLITPVIITCRYSMKNTC